MGRQVESGTDVDVDDAVDVNQDGHLACIRPSLILKINNLIRNKLTHQIIHNLGTFRYIDIHST